MWTLAPAALVATSTAAFRYDGGGPYDPARCASHWTPAAAQLAALIRERFPWVHTIGGIRCERIATAHGDELSIHATGRALDVMVPTLAGAEGLALANWLVEHAKSLGLQLVIWDRGVWQGTLARYGVQPYGGPNDHVDHVHVEVLADAHPSTGALGTGAMVAIVASASAGVLGVVAFVASIVKRNRRRS